MAATRPTGASPNALRHHESLEDLPPEVAAALMQRGQQRHWRRGQVVLQQGVDSAVVVVGLQGRLAAYLGAASGRSTLLRWLRPQEIVGMPAALAGLPSTVSIVAEGQATTLHIEREAFIQILRQHPEGAIAIAVLVSHRLGELFQYVERTEARPLAERVDFALRRLASSQGERARDGTVQLKLTQAELAMAAGASRQRVHLALRQLQAEGRLHLGYGLVQLLPAFWAAPPPENPPVAKPSPQAA